MRGAESRECLDCGRVLPIKKFQEGRKKCFKCRNIKKNYGITGREFFALLEDQMGYCVICEDPINEKTAVIDHCHDSKKVRTLLCTHCNLGIGHLKHDKEITHRAFEYLSFFK